MYSGDHIARLNLIHSKTLRQSFHVKSTFYHKVLSQCEEDCSNAYLMCLAYEHSPQLRTPPQYTQSARIACLGRALRHSDTLEALITFNSAHGYRQLSTLDPEPPIYTWAELSMAEAYNGHQYPSSARSSGGGGRGLVFCNHFPPGGGGPHRTIPIPGEGGSTLESYHGRKGLHVRMSTEKNLVA